MINLRKKITIVGNAGSGKTTLALQLKEKLNLPLYHLDEYYWKDDWQKVEIESFRKAHDALCEQPQWIIEGSYVKFFPNRAAHADVIIFLDLPTHRCMWYVIKRALVNWGKVIPGSPDNCIQQLFSRKFFSFLNWVWNFNKKYHAMILNTLNECEDGKLVYILKSPKEITEFIKQLEK